MLFRSGRRLVVRRAAGGVEDVVRVVRGIEGDKLDGAALIGVPDLHDTDARVLVGGHEDDLVKGPVHLDVHPPLGVGGPPLQSAALAHEDPLDRLPIEGDRQRDDVSDLDLDRRLLGLGNVRRVGVRGFASAGKQMRDFMPGVIAIGRQTLLADSDTDTDSDSDTDVADLANGQDIHDMTCANDYCHGSNTYLDDRVPTLTDEQIEDTVTNGKNYMPAQDPLSGDDVRDVIAYLRTIY